MVTYPYFTGGDGRGGEGRVSCVFHHSKLVGLAVDCSVCGGELEGLTVTMSLRGVVMRCGCGAVYSNKGRST